jgi:uncharacterized heparinase superfamily protein
VGLLEKVGPGSFPEWQPQAARKMLATREFSFLNRTVASNGSIPWNDHRYSKLWLYHLNYFDFLNITFDLPRDELLLRRGLEFALDWLRHNKQGNEVGWESYPLSVRIVNWLKFLSRIQDSGFRVQEIETSLLLESVGVQAATLEHRLEKDLLANHLLKNAKALLFAGACLETSLSSRWWAKGERLLERELNEQILPDGGHFERSPMYHSQVLEDLADVQHLCASLGKPLACSDLLGEKIQAMAQFLQGVVHPDGEIPLFNDSVLGEARSPGSLLAICGLPASGDKPRSPLVKVFPDTGYGVIRNPESRSALIFDCGPLGPDYQPGHGHCDTLSYELSLQGHRVVVDAGVSTYERGPVRYAERATASHNTLRVDGEELAEIWAAFRVGRRPRVGRMGGGTEGAFRFLSGRHEAYRRRGIGHARKILWQGPDTWIVADLIEGSGHHRVESYLHFHPLVRIEALDDLIDDAAGLPLRRWKVSFAGQTYGLLILGEGQFELIESRYSDYFGKCQAARALRWTYEGIIPVGFIHIFIPATVPLPRIAASWSEGWIEIDGKRITLP